MRDSDGAVTYTLLRGAGYVKDLKSDDTAEVRTFERLYKKRDNGSTPAVSLKLIVE